MKKIEIKIPDSLTPQQEIIAIAKKLNQKALSNNSVNKEQILIGQGVKVIDLETQITVKRISTDKPIEMIACNVCGNIYQNNTAIYYWHNYGGNPKKTPVCSARCQHTVIQLLGNRAAISRNKLKTAIVYRY